MKEIKFRAWDKNKREMREVTSLNFYDEYIWVDETPMTGDRLPLYTTPIMQCTGLKDKNGKEIYEGDIVEIENQKYVVKFKDGSFVGEHTKTKTSPVLYILMTYPMPLQNRCKVLGNIYENSGLLN